MFRIKACEGIYHYLSLKLISSHFYFKLIYSTFNIPDLKNLSFIQIPDYTTPIDIPTSNPIVPNDGLLATYMRVVDTYRSFKINNTTFGSSVGGSYNNQDVITSIVKEGDILAGGSAYTLFPFEKQRSITNFLIIY